MLVTFACYVIVISLVVFGFWKLFGNKLVDKIVPEKEQRKTLTDKLEALKKGRTELRENTEELEVSKKLEIMDELISKTECEIEVINKNLGINNPS